MGTTQPKKSCRPTIAFCKSIVQDDRHFVKPFYKLPIFTVRGIPAFSYFFFYLLLSLLRPYKIIMHATTLTRQLAQYFFLKHIRNFTKCR